MKKLFFFIFLLFIVNSTTKAQSLEIVNDAIAKSDLAFFQKNINSSLELCVNQDHDLYSKEKAVERINRFFTETKPKSAKMIHNGSSKGKDSVFGVSQLVTEQGKFRVYITMKMIGENYKISELRFEKDNL